MRLVDTAMRLLGVDLPARLRFNDRLTRTIESVGRDHAPELACAAVERPIGIAERFENRQVFPVPRFDDRPYLGARADLYVAHSLSPFAAARSMRSNNVRRSSLRISPKSSCGFDKPFM